MMTQPVNLLARDDFKNGEEGYVLGDGVKLGDGVRKLKDKGAPHGAVLVTALADINAGAHGHFQEATRPRRPVTPIVQLESKPERRITPDRRAHPRGGRRSTDNATPEEHERRAKQTVESLNPQVPNQHPRSEPQT